MIIGPGNIYTISAGKLWPGCVKPEKPYPCYAIVSVFWAGIACM